MSFVRLQDVERGYDAANVLTAEVSLPFARYGTVAQRTDDDPRGQFWRELTRHLESEPGVVAAGLTSRLPLRGDSWGDGAVPEGGFASTVDPQPDMQYRWVSPNYWSAMGIPVMSGRAFDESDRPGRVAVLSERVARALWPDQDPIGRRFYRGSPDDLYAVVGIVPDVHAVDLADEPVPLVYLPRWEPGAPITSVAIRTVGDPRAMAATLREVVASVDPELAISDVETMTQIDRRVFEERRFALILVIVFAVASLLIAAVGTYSVLAYAVAGRRHELAVRLSLGAQPGRIKSMVIRQGIQSVLVGLALGLGAALMLGRALSGMLFSVSSTDPVPFALVMVVTLVAAAIACWVPARRAASANTLDLLRGEFHG
jgi:putative ABC transport system permease protein